MPQYRIVVKGEITIEAKSTDDATRDAWDIITEELLLSEAEVVSVVEEAEVTP